MNTTDLYNLLLSKPDGITLTGEYTELLKTKKRLIAKKHRELKSLGEFADNSRTLVFEWLALADDKSKLRVALSTRAEDLNIEVE